ncbi:MAG TPA: hypothetical protein VG674_26655 [Amycolatopsis sp.]|nr:hypothetical protein [Amycolatopsis sp.]
MIAKALHRTIETVPRRWILVAAAILAIGSAIAVSGYGSPTFADLSSPVQGVLAIVVPFTGVLAADSRYPVGRTLAAASVVGAGAGVFGAAVCAMAAATSPALFVWHGAALVVAGSVLVQVVAQWVGTGLGFLIRHRLTACLASVVLPLALWFVLGVIHPPLQPWLTPYPSVRHLLSGSMSAAEWAQCGVVAVLWGIGLSAAGAGRATASQA